MIEYIIILFLILGIASVAISTLTKGMNQMADRTKEKMNTTEGKSDESSSKDTNKSKEDTSKATVKNEDTQKQETPKQETKETQAPTTVINNITNNNQVQNTTVVINEAKVPTQQDNSFLSNLGSNLVAELVVAVLFAGLSWFIKSKVDKRKQKLNMKKD